MATSKNIHSLQSLEKEIYKLQLKAKAIEQELDENFEHLQDNFHGMAWNSLIRYKRSSQSWSAGIVQGILSQERLQDALARLVSWLADKLSEGADSLLDRLFGRKHRDH